jgi:hypothetical protein
MTVVHDLVEDCIEMRARLQRQLKALESDRAGAGTLVVGSSTDSTILRIRRLIEELNELLKECARDDKT